MSEDFNRVMVCPFCNKKAYQISDSVSDNFAKIEENSLKHMNGNMFLMGEEICCDACGQVVIPNSENFKDID